jgi:ATP-binding cassette subfamily B protein
MAETKVPAKPQYGRILRGYLLPQARGVAVLGACLLAGIGLQLVGPQILRAFIDAAQSGAADSVLIWQGVWFIAVSVVQQVANVGATYYSETIGWNATNALRKDLVEHCLGLDLGFFGAKTPGEMIERLDGDVNSLANFLSQLILQVLGNGLLLLGVLALLFAVDWRAGLVNLGFVGVGGWVLYRLQNLAVPYWEAERQASADLFGFLEERLNGTEDIRANGGRDYVLRRFFGLVRVLMQRNTRAGLAISVLVNSSWLLFAVGNAAGLGVAAYLYINGQVSMGTAFMCGYYTNLVLMPVERILSQLNDLQRAGASVGRVTTLLETRPAIAEQPAPAEARLADGRLGVAFEQVHFRYEEDGAAVLDGIDFALAPGTALGLLGRTGSGKTTLARLVFRLYDPQAGAVRVGGEDLRGLTTGELRSRVGMVSQNIQLFHASLRDNLTFFDRTVADERIRAVLDELGLGEWFRRLPNGLDTELESGTGSAAGGVGLSAGEAQLLAFSRVFLRRPGLVILDEATSRLDPATQALIERAVDRLVSECTAIIIAHRLETVRRVDRILILEDGRVAEFGERAALEADSGSRFHGLLQLGLEEVLA